MIETSRGWLAGGPVGFVPTRGYLHEGHAVLVQAANAECDISVASIFENPLPVGQFGNLIHYPSDVDRDLQLLRAAQLDVAFVPRFEDVYPSSFATYVNPTGPLTERLEGIYNSASLRSVATLMTKLFQLVRPDIAYFPQKDAQQVAVIRQVVRDLNIDITLCILPTSREQSGLARSSRNAFLSSPEHQAAILLYRALLEAKVLIDGGEYRSPLLEKAMRDLVAAEPLISLEYAAVCNPETFREVKQGAPGTMLAIAARIGSARLIDNIVWRIDRQWSL
ncbi:MAG: pantoate--beta-alanine ligase [Chloroflexota bacterium]|nr:pantoate--beta-alanine ligase [Chloroflexota bacterium]